MSNDASTRIDRSTGEIALDGGELIGPSLTLHAFSMSTLAGGEPPMIGGGAWSSHVVAARTIGGTSFAITLRFEGEALRMVELAAVVPGASWADWSEREELARKSRHDAWLVAQLGDAPWSYPWGCIESNYDVRSGSSGISFVYG